ncbi:MAG: phosphodiester glycosidase family protein [Clostridia bacterium]|nr:phosphodiester glycosidase family protein [Clostridia bacterium]
MLGVTLLALILFVVGVCWVLLKGPSPTARDMFVNTLQETSALKFVPHLFLPDELIADIIDGNTVIETDVTTDNTTEFVEKEESVPPETIEVKDVTGSTYAGKMMIVHDPSRVKVASINAFGESYHGRSVVQFAKDYKAVASVNGGGFFDENGQGTGGTPLGIVIRDGKLLYGAESDVSTLVAFDTSNRLIVGKMSAADALSRNVRDAISFGPAFIINGVPAEISGTSGGVNPRTVIGQRADGAVLILVIDGRQAHSLGATYKDCIDIMLEYGAINAANLDGGSSTAMVYNGEIINKCSSMYRLRNIPTSIVVI